MDEWDVCKLPYPGQRHLSVLAPGLSPSVPRLRHWLRQLTWNMAQQEPHDHTADLRDTGDRQIMQS